MRPRSMGQPAATLTANSGSSTDSGPVSAVSVGAPLCWHGMTREFERVSALRRHSRESGNPGGLLLICGGGVIGASIAYFLSCRGVKATVIESTALTCAASGKSVSGARLVRWDTPRAAGAAQLRTACGIERDARRGLGLSPARYLRRLRRVSCSAQRLPPRLASIRRNSRPSAWFF